MGRRRQAREIALQALYIIDTSGTPEAEAFAIVNRRQEPDDEKTLTFARELLSGANEKRPELICSQVFQRLIMENYELKLTLKYQRSLLILLDQRLQMNSGLLIIVLVRNVKVRRMITNTRAMMT